MATNDQNTIQINKNTAAINAITENSKNIDDFDLQSPLELTSEFPISDEGVDYKTNVAAIVGRVNAALTATITTEHPILLPFSFPLNTKTSLDSIYGSLLINNSEDGIILNSGQDIIGNGGISKVMAVVLAGTVLTGSYTITGTSVDRDTSVETPGDSEVVNVDGLSIDTSTTDANGNDVHGFSNAYLSTKWWKGQLTFSTTDLDLTEIRFSQLSFEQSNDSSGLTLNSFNANYLISNSNAVMDAYLYTVIVNGSTVTVSNVASLHHESGEFADASFRRRIGNIGVELDGVTSGIFIDLFLKPDALQYFSSFTMDVWLLKKVTVNVVFT